jgi:two-component system, LytTR family, sensor kinase
MKIRSYPVKPFNIWFFIFGNAVLSLIILMVFFGKAFLSPERFFIGFFWSYARCATQCAGPVFINIFLDKRIQWLDRPVTRTIVEIISLLAWSVGSFIAVQLIMYYLVLHQLPYVAWQSISQFVIYTLLISLFISLIFSVVGFFKAWRKSVLNEAELKSQMMSYKYEALRNQINPHFLFNSFNVLSDLVYDDQAQAVKFIRQMSDLFRYVIDSRDKELVTLDEEMNFLNSYIYLLKTRFGDKLNLKIKFLPQASELIVPMTLQLLVENAVKHNEVSERFPLSIEVRRNDGYIEVENSLRKKNVGEDSKNTGLKNISQQYSFFTEKEIEVIHDEISFLVRIPLIQSAEK